MPCKIKDWEKLQHYKNRRPPWIRLYRDLLDDGDMFAISGDDFRFLIMLWLIASEDELLEGYLPASAKLAWRLRISEAETVALLNRLNHWIILDDSAVLAECTQDATPDQIRSDQTRPKTEKTRTPKPPRGHSQDFLAWYETYPNKVAKDAAWRTWEKRRKDGSLPLLSILTNAVFQQKSQRMIKSSKGQFTPPWPNPATWINGGRWEDETAVETTQEEIKYDE